MVKFQKIGGLSFARLNAVLMALIGLIAGMLYPFGGAIIDGLVSAGWVISSETPGLAYGTVLAFGAIIGMPVLFSLIGFAYGAVAAFLCNVAAKSVGGWIRALIGEVRIEFK